MGPEVTDGLVRSNDNLQAWVLAPRYLGNCVFASAGGRVMEDLNQGINRPHLEQGTITGIRAREAQEKEHGAPA